MVELWLADMIIKMSPIGAVLFSSMYTALRGQKQPMKIVKFSWGSNFSREPCKGGALHMWWLGI